MPKRQSIKLDKNSAEYQEKRARNNMAVKKSRQKSRMRESENSEQVQRLRQENADLERKADILKKELAFLKDMFVAYASGRSNEPFSNETEVGPSNSAAATMSSSSTTINSELETTNDVKQ